MNPKPLKTRAKAKARQAPTLPAQEQDKPEPRCAYCGEPWPDYACPAHGELARYDRGEQVW